MKLELPVKLHPRDGTYKEDGVEGAYKHGLREGPWKTFFANGQREQEYHWERGVKHGPELDWYANGTHCCDGRNERGARVGVWSWWYDNGERQETTHYEHGKRHGKTEEGTTAGAIQVTGAYLDDQRHGPWLWIDSGNYSRYELGYDRGQNHGKELAWFKDGTLAIKRTWVRGVKHGEEETFDAEGPLFKGEWYFGIPVGTHIAWSRPEKEESRTVFVHGIPEALAADAKLPAKVQKKLAKAKDQWAKRDALDDVDYDYRGAYLVHLWREGHVDVAAEPGLWETFAGASAAMSGEELVRFLRKVKVKGLDGHVVPAWSRDLDKIVVEVYARDPEPLDEAWETFKGPLRPGIAFVRARFGQDIGDELYDLMPKLAEQHVVNYGLPEVLWPDVDGVVREVKLRGTDAARTPFFDLVVAWFGGFDRWVREVRTLMFREAKETVARVLFPQGRDVIELATPAEMSTLIAGIALDSSTQDCIRRALLEWRSDDAATLTKIALGVDDTGLRKWPAMACAILAHRGAPVPDALVDALRLDHESPTYTGSWYREPLSAVPEEVRNNPYYRTEYIGSLIGVAVPRMQLLREAFAALSPEQRRRVVERQLGEAYANMSVAQYLYLVDDPALWERFLDIAERDTYGHGDAVMYGVGELGARIVPSLIARRERAKTKEWREAYSTALVVACARTIADGELPPAWDEYVDFAIAHEAAYAPFVERILCKLPIERAERLLLSGLGAADASTFAIAFAMIAAAPTRAVIEKAFATLLEREAKLTANQQHLVGDGVATLPDARAYVTAFLRAGGGGGLGDNLKRAIGWKVYEEIEKELAAAGVAKPVEIDAIEKLRLLAKDAGGSGERLYVLRRLDAPVAGTLNVIGGLPPGIGADRWPTHDDEPMAHLFTLDVRTMPELAPRVGKDARTVSVFCWHPDLNEAWESGNDQTAIVISTEAQAQAQATPPDDVPERRVYGFEPVAIDVAPDVWTGDSALRKQIYVAHARVLGEPQWLQDEAGGGSEAGFLMQFDQGFCDVNLGDMGVMYVYDGDAFWQCH